jgi:hypothetical protein
VPARENFEALDFFVGRRLGHTSVALSAEIYDDDDIHPSHRPPALTAQHVRPHISRPEALRLRCPPRDGSPPGRWRSTAEDTAEMAV